MDEFKGWFGMSDAAVLREIGERVKQYRLNLNLTQQMIADRAGIHRSTLSAFENGTSASLLTFVQVMRALDALDSLDYFLPNPGPSPLQMAELEGRERKRASKKGLYDDAEW